MNGNRNLKGNVLFRFPEASPSRFYDEVIRLPGQPDAILIFGPGEAKLQLKERLSRSKALSEHIVGIETTDKLTDPQVVAKVKEHYGMDR